MKVLFVLMVLVIAPFSTGAMSWGPQDAQVWQIGDLPCFSVADNKETRRHPPLLAHITVYRKVSGRSEMIWSFSPIRKDGLMYLPPDKCISYGAISMQPALGETAPKLQVGAEYTAEINSAIPSDKKRSNRRYRAYFCVVAGEGAGDTRVRQVKWDKRKEIWDWGVCRSPGGRPEVSTSRTDAGRR